MPNPDIHIRAGELIKRAKSYLVVNRAFISTILLNMEFQESMTIRGTDRPNPGFWTDGKTVGYNPEFVANHSYNEILASLGNMSTRIALAHHLRREGRDEGIWNDAGNNVANLILKEEGFKLAPTDPCEQRFTGKSTEQVFQELQKEAKKKPKPQDGQNGQNGKGNTVVVDQQGESGEEMTEVEIRQAERDLKDLISQAVEVEKSFGKDRGFVERFSKLLETKNDWRSELMDFMTPNPIKNDYSWSRPVKKFIPAGIYLPHMYGEELVDMVVAIDVSGSIGDNDLSLFAGVINDILQVFPSTRIHVIYCDTQVRKTEEFTSEDCPIKLKSVGGGGTAFDPVFRWVAKHEINPKVLLYITDLCGPVVDKKLTPEYAVGWVVPKRYYDENLRRQVAYFGKYIQIEE